MSVLAERLREPLWIALGHHVNAENSDRMGQWSTAREYSDLGLALGSLNTIFLGTRTLMEHDVGDFDQGQGFLDQLLEVMRHVPPEIGLAHAQTAATLALVARITGNLDHLDFAQTSGEFGHSSPTATPMFALMARAGLALVGGCSGTTRGLLRSITTL